MKLTKILKEETKNFNNQRKRKTKTLEEIYNSLKEIQEKLHICRKLYKPGAGGARL